MDKRINRRWFIGGAIAFGAGVALERVRQSFESGAASNNTSTEIATPQDAYPYYLATATPEGIVSTATPQSDAQDLSLSDVEVTQIATGGGHVLALTKNGEVIAWGDNTYGQTDVPSGLRDVVAIAAGLYHSLAVTIRGEVVAWGGQNTVPTGLNGVIAVAAGYFHSLALTKNGDVIAWGDNTQGQTDVPVNVRNISSINAWKQSSFAITQQGDVIAWGLGDYSVTADLRNVAAISGDLSNLFILTKSGEVEWYYHNVLNDVIPYLRDVEIVAIAGGESVFPLALTKSGEVIGVGQESGLNNIIMINTMYSGESYKYSAYAVTKNGKVKSWGKGKWSQSRHIILTNDKIHNVRAFSVGWSTAYTLANDGSLIKFRRRDEVSFPVDLRDVVATAVYESLLDEYDYSLALTKNGEVIAWGNNDVGQTNVPSDVRDVVAIAVYRSPNDEYHYSLALTKNGEVVEWGQHVQLDYVWEGWPEFRPILPDLRDVVAIAVGEHHALALTTQGRVVAWGYNNNGQIDVPTDLQDIIAIAASDDVSLALTKSGEVVAWGSNYSGQIDVPKGLRDVVAVAMWSGSSFAVTKSGEMVMWGDEYLFNVTSDLRDVRRIAIGEDGLIALTHQGEAIIWSQGDIWSDSEIVDRVKDVVDIVAWGSSMVLTSDGKAIITNTRSAANRATNIIELHDVKMIGAVHNGFLAVKNSGETVVWGGDDAPSWLRNVSSLVSAGNHFLALTQEGSIVAWGSNSDGQIDIPQDLRDIVAVAAGGNYSLAVTSAGKVLAWGTNNACTIPEDLHSVVNVAAGGKHALALTRQGKVVAWGDNDKGQTDVLTNLQDVVAIAAGAAFSLAITSAGEVIAWGDNSQGQTDVPPGLRDVVTVATDTAHTIALTRAGEVVVWGRYRTLPTVFAGINDVVQIGAGSDMILAQRRDGTIVQGFFGDPTDVPLAIRAEM